MNEELEAREARKDREDDYRIAEALRELREIRAQSAQARQWAPSRWHPFGARRGPNSYWYRAQYLLTAYAAHGQLTEWLRKSSATAQRAAEARREATSLVTVIEVELGSVPAGATAQAFYSFLADIEAPSTELDTPAYATFARLGFRRPYVRMHFARL